MSDPAILRAIYDTILERKRTMPEGSYTSYLFREGIDKILKKVGEESAETIIASKNADADELTAETSDLVYHLLVMLAWHDIEPERIFEELAKRHG